MKLTVRIAALFAVCMFVGKTYAQQLVMSYHPEERVDKSYSTFASAENQLCEDAENVYEQVPQSVDLTKVIIRKSSKATGKKVWEKSIAIQTGQPNNTTRFSNLQKTSTGYILFVKREDAKLKESYLGVQVLDENLKTWGEEEPMGNCSFRDDGAFKLNYKVIRDGNHFLIYPLANDQKNKPFKFTLIDDKAHITWEKEVEFPEDQFFQVHTVKLNSNLSMKALFLLSSNGKKNNDNACISNYFVASYNYLKSDLKTTTIEMAGKVNRFGNDLADFESDANTLFISGQCIKNPKAKGYDGLFNIEFNLSNMKTDVLNIVNYSNDLLTEMVAGKKGGKLEANEKYTIQNQYADENGGMTYVLELQQSGIDKATSKTQFKYGKIIVLKASAKGEVVWFKSIKRNATAFSANYAAATSLLLKDKVIILFNASAASAKSPDTETGYQFSPIENTLVAKMYDTSGDELVTETFVPKVPKGLSCNLQMVRLTGATTAELYFEKVNKTSLRVEAVTRANFALE